jgi:mandelate racemase
MTDSSLVIRRILGRPVLVPMKLPLHTASGAIDRAALVLLDLETTSGIIGRAYLFAPSAAHLAPIVALVEAMSEMLAGDAVVPFEIERKLRARHRLLGVHNIVLFAMSGIDMAAWDALGQSLNQPLTVLLGGKPQPVRAYNSKGLGIMPLPALASQARQLVDQGFDAVKLRLGRTDARDDMGALRAVKKAIGDNVILMVDFNQGLTVAEALRRGHMIDAEGGVYWIEEPIRADDFAGCAKVAREIRTPIQIGENFMGPEQMAQALAAGACDYVMPDLERIGGVTGWMRAAALAQGAGVEMSSHLFAEASARLLPVTATAHWLEYVDWADPVLAEPLRIEKGFAMPSLRPGLGMAWNERAVKKYLV